MNPPLLSISVPPLVPNFFPVLFQCLSRSLPISSPTLLASPIFYLTSTLRFLHFVFHEGSIATLWVARVTGNWPVNAKLYVSRF